MSEATQPAEGKARKCRPSRGEGITIERINGVVFAMTRPRIRHIGVVRNIDWLFCRKLAGNGCRCQSFPEPDVQFDRNTVVSPDVVIVCDPEKIKERRIEGAPDLVVEVLSPSTGKRDRTEKFALYERFGVKEYWIVEPAAQSVDVFLLKDGRFEYDNHYANVGKEEFDDSTAEQQAEIHTVIPVTVCGGFDVDLKDIFAD